MATSYLGLRNNLITSPPRQPSALMLQAAEPTFHRAAPKICPSRIESSGRHVHDPSRSGDEGHQHHGELLSSGLNQDCSGLGRGAQQTLPDGAKTTASG